MQANRHAIELDKNENGETSPRSNSLQKQLYKGRSTTTVGNHASNLTVGNVPKAGLRVEMIAPNQLHHQKAKNMTTSSPKLSLTGVA